MASYLDEINWFEWNGVKCTEYGMIVLNQPTIMRASERTESVTIPGKSGNLTLTEGTDVYDSLSVYCTCLINDPFKVTDNGGTVISEICGWLKGQGIVRFANRPNGFYIARISSQISFDKIVAGNPHRSFAVSFQCRPNLYLDSGLLKVTASETSTRLHNEGNVDSEPVMKVFGTSEGTIMCGGNTMLVNSFDGIDYIVIDCESKVAYKGELSNPSDPLVLLGTRVSGEWLKIPKGDSFFTISGGISSVEITPNWRCI